MTRSHSAPAKISRPQTPPGTVLRPRLFELLQRPGSSVSWIVAPPGAGKTTLVSSYLEQSLASCVWYQCDQGDSDPATFFHYLGLAAKLAAPRTKRPLAHLTPEYLPAISLFAQRYFEEFYARLKLPCVVVFDNYQDVAADAALHTILCNAFLSLPPGMRVIVLSRDEPPAAMARLRATRVFSLVNWEAIRLTADESAAIAATRNPHLSVAAAARLYAQTQGWAAGVVLALEGDGALREGADEEMPPQVVFDYFAGEILSAMTPQEQHILLCCAFMPWVREQQAVELSGVASAGKILSRLGARGYFVVKHASGFQLHPLFRVFLKNRARHAFSAEQLSDVRKRAATLMEPDGAVAEAAALLCESAAWRELAQLAIRHAPALLQQGRGATLQEWLNLLPESVAAEMPWLLYWRGVCRMPQAPLESRSAFAAAFERFGIQGDHAGYWLAWSGVVETFFVEWGDFSGLDRWIAVLDETLARGDELPSGEIATRVACSMFVALTWRRPDRADLVQWAEQVMRICLESDDLPLKMLLGNALLSYYTIVGDFSKTPVVVDALRVAGSSKENTPLTQLQWWTMLAMYSWFAGDHSGCLKAIAEGEHLAQESGIHLLDANLYAQGIYSAVSNGDGDLASRFLEQMLAAGLPRPMDKTLYHYQAASVYLQRGDLARAKEHGLAAKSLAIGNGTPIPQALVSTDLACTLFALGEEIQAEQELVHAASVGRGMNLVAYMVDLYRAGFAQQRGDEQGALDALRRALALAARCSFVNAPRWNPPLMAHLLALALEHGIEPEHVRKVIALRKVTPPAQVRHSEAWPRPIRIYTLGGFQVIRDGAPLRFSGKAQRKPLELLQALIAFGGENVPVQKLAESVWSDEEIGAPIRALYTTLHRVRKLLGDDDAVVLAGNQLSFDHARVWVDVWALEHDLSQLDRGQFAATTRERLERALQRYRGAFLQEEREATWALPLREHLASRVRHAIAQCGAAAQQCHAWEDAVACFERGLLMDPLDEEFYRHLMVAHHALGRSAQVSAVYRRCTQMLRQQLGVAVAPKTEALYRSLVPTA